MKAKLVYELTQQEWDEVCLNPPAGARPMKPSPTVVEGPIHRPKGRYCDNCGGFSGPVRIYVVCPYCFAHLRHDAGLGRKVRDLIEECESCADSDFLYEILKAVEIHEANPH